MGKFKVEADGLPRQEIEAENAEKAAWEYCGVLQMDEQMIKKRSDEECISVFDEKGQKTTFRAEIIADDLELSRMIGGTKWKSLK